MKKTKTIKELSRVDRPREKLIHYGPEKLSNSELLAIILRSGPKGENVVKLSSRLLKKIGKEKIINTKYQKLNAIHGLGPAKSCQIIACFELGKRLLKDKKAKIYLTAEDVFKELRDIRNHKKEHFVVFYLDINNQEIKREIISIGILNSALVHPREVFESAIKNSASQILLAHNHPSGNTKPTEADINITNRLVEAGDILGIKVIDHIIVTKNKFLSMKEEKNI